MTNDCNIVSTSGGNVFVDDDDDSDDDSDHTMLEYNRLTTPNFSDDDGGSDWNLVQDQEPMAEQQLGEWLGQLELMSQELDSVRPAKMPTANDGDTNRPTNGACSPAASSSTAAAGGVKVRQRPAVPPKPPMDTIRYSMANVKDSADTDLDALLGELYALESQLNSDSASDSLLLGLPILPNTSSSVCPQSSAKTSPIPKSNNNHNDAPAVVHQSNNSIQLPLTNGASRLASKANDSIGNNHHHHRQQASIHTIGNNNNLAPCTAIGVRTCSSPDADSAYGEGSSMLSNESSTRCRDSNLSSTDSSRGSLNTPSPTQQNSTETIAQSTSFNGAADVDKTNNTIVTISEESEAAREKAEKIKLALEKMKEANIKKLFVKFFTADSGSKSLLVDERSTTAHVLKQLADKHRITLTINHAIVEAYPDLCMERIYEDHEYLVENVLMWTRDSPNKLYFIDRPTDKYAFMDQPQNYLLNDGDSSSQSKMDPSRKQQIIQEFFDDTHNIQPPEIEGALYLKVDGKKVWKKHYFVLRASGLYYIPKGKSKSSKDLQCLMSLQVNQVYGAVGWKRKYKAPTDFGFAIKHPQIQVKASKYIKYLCADDDMTYRRWMVALRLAKNGRQLYNNYESMQTHLNSVAAISTNQTTNGASPIVADYIQPSVIMRPRSTISNHSSTTSSSESNRPISIDTTGSGRKRNSGLIKVELPIIPDDGVATAYVPESGSQTPTSSCSGGGGGVGVTATNDQLVFEQSDDVTGTIKRQPMELNRRIAAAAVNSSHISLERRQSSEGGSLKDELDSDEEQFPPPPPPIIIDAPSPSQPIEVVVNHISTNGLATGTKRPPPPLPPKRSENTRLTMQSAPTTTTINRPPPPIAIKPTNQQAMMVESSGFQSELELAMARRLNRCEPSARHPPPTPPPKRVPSNGHQC